MAVVRGLLAAALCLAACNLERPASVGSSGQTAPGASGEAKDSSTPPPIPQCPGTAPGFSVGRLANKEIDEASGLAVSQLDPELFWVHNDSGDDPRLFALTRGGRQVAELSVLGAGAYDWEDIAAGPVLEGGVPSLFIGDIGDNFARRDNVQIYILREPEVDRSLASAELATSAHRLDVTYPDGPRNAEALLVDPLTGDLYIVEKADYRTPEAVVGIYRIPALEVLSESAVAQRVAELPLGPVTGGAVLANGRGVALRNYQLARFYERDPVLPLFHAFAEPSCELPLADLEQQGEALAFARDGKSYFTVAEGAGRDIYGYAFRPPTRVIQLADACTSCARNGKCGRLACKRRARHNP